jgi:glycosyltransferase involved in cell wall biosynthesis
VIPPPSTRPGLRICLLTGGGYPYRRDALGGWCRTVVEGLAGIRFDLVTVIDREPPAALAYRLPGNVVSVRAVTLGRDASGRDDRRRATPDDPATAAALLLCRGLLGEQDNADGMVAEGLRRLAGATADAGVGRPVLAGVPLADILQDAWRAGRAVAGEDRLPLPRLSVRDARTAAALLRHATRALAVPPPDADLIHCVGGTTPLLAALAGHWRTGTPVLLTEARTPVARSRPAEERLSPAVRTVLRRFRRAVARTGYAEAGLIAPLSAYHHDWALRHGARPGRLVPVPAGVDPRDYPTAPEPAVDRPAVVWAGSGGPGSGLEPLLAAFATVVARVPGAVLHLVGVTVAHEDHCAEQIERTGLGRAVRLHPLPADPRDRYAAGHVVVHVPGPADPPYRLIEAMMSGRAVVGVDIGPAAETLGDAGVLVPPGDPAALAGACVELLGDPARRRTLGEAARQRALAYFTTDRVVRVYGALYTDLASPPPAAPAHELALSIPAPRTALPTTMRWLIREDR